MSGRDVDDFARDGAICLRGALEPKWIELLRRGVSSNMADPGPYSCEYTPDTSPGRFWDDYCNWDRIDEYRTVVLDSPLGSIAAAAMQSRTARLFHEHVLVKEAGTSEITPWHHDQPYYCVDGDQCLSIWVPLDEVTLEASPRFIAGSHHGPMYLPRNFRTHLDYPYGELFEPVPDIDATLAEHRVLQWAVSPGDCIVFHMRTLHGAAGTSERRRAFSTRWIGDDATYAVRPAPTSPPFPELADVLSPGDPLVHALFPLVVGD